MKITVARGVKMAVSKVDRCTQSTQTAFQFMTLLEGIQIEKKTQIFESVQLVPLPLSSSELPDYLPDLDYWYRPRDFMGKTLLIIDASVSPLFTKPDLEKGPRALFKHEIRGTLPKFDNPHRDFYSVSALLGTWERIKQIGRC